MLTNILLIYLMGALIGFGLAYTATSGSWFDPEEAGVSRGVILKWGFILSWLTVIICIGGFLLGFGKASGGGDEDDR